MVSWCRHLSSQNRIPKKRPAKNQPPRLPTGHGPAMAAMALWGDQRWSPRWAGRPTALGCHRNFAKESPGHWSSIRHPALQKGGMRLYPGYIRLHCSESQQFIWVYLVFSSPQHQENHGFWLFDLKPPFTMVLVCLEKRRWWWLRTPQLHWIIIFLIQLALFGTVWNYETPFG